MIVNRIMGKKILFVDSYLARIYSTPKTPHYARRLSGPHKFCNKSSMHRDDYIANWGCDIMMFTEQTLDAHLGDDWAGGLPSLPKAIITPKPQDPL